MADPTQAIDSATSVVVGTGSAASSVAMSLITQWTDFFFGVPISVPMPTLQLADLYSITVGFENGTGGPAPTGRKTRKKKTSG